MKQPSKKVVKAWACVRYGHLECELIFPDDELLRAEDWCKGVRGRRVKRVEITYEVPDGE